MFASLKSAFQKLPIVQDIIVERDKLQTELKRLKRKQGFVPPGHFYSPIPSLREIRQDEAQIFASPAKTIPGLELHESKQLHLLEQFVPYYQEMPFQADQVAGLRYYFENLAYSYSDAILLYCMLRFLKPKRIVEVGSGFSSCLMLDTNDRFFDGSILTTFIEPRPKLLTSLIEGSDRSNVTIIPLRLQDVPLGAFESLEANDILFIDSTHVSKINSDVNRIFFEILPKLASGVYVHFHDIFFPFEYPKAWIYEGRAWNEAYMLRAFLQYNNSFQVVLMNTFMQQFHASFFQTNMPLCLKNPGGSIWIRKE
ncbi:MAG: class I SAM-dependent methyltransferase [Oculatellaceae cyanobacterium bins.114]|nr:class I SAM-dependent methyltransferase [Oculatellaceae cyanobacterium bins.114]